MGRTLHYSLTKPSGNLSAKERQSIQAINQRYNSGNFEKLWSCESFFVDDEQPKTPTYQLRGFAKVQGNELNALMVLLALVELSQRCPKVELHLSDEGEFLLCDLRIRNGKAIPDLRSLSKEIHRYCQLMLLSDGFKDNILNQLQYKPTDFSHEFMMDSHLGNSYGDMTQHINFKLRNLKEIEDVLIKQGLTGNELYWSNLEDRNGNDWFDPMVFTRKVEVQKYVNYKITPATIMDGFNGEGFGLSEEESEAKAYRSIAQLQSLFNSHSIDLKILGESPE